jgi:hypothetical protein
MYNHCISLHKLTKCPKPISPSGPRPPHRWVFEITLRLRTFGRLLRTSDRPVAENFTWQHTTLTRDRHSCARHDSTPQSQQVSGRRLAPQTARSLRSPNWLICSITFSAFVSWSAVAAPGTGQTSLGVLVCYVTTMSDTATCDRVLDRRSPKRKGFKWWRCRFNSTTSVVAKSSLYA